MSQRMREPGSQLDDTARTMLGARIPRELHRKLRHMAIDEGMTVQAFVERVMTRLVRPGEREAA